MTYRVKISQAARRDLEEIYDWIWAHDSPAHTDYVIDRLSKAAESIATFPRRGARPPELPPGMKADYHQVYFKPYRVIYQIRKADIMNHLIADGRRNLQSLLLRRLIGEWTGPRSRP